MIALLKFNLDNPEDVKSHLCCVKAKDMAIVLFEVTHNLQRMINSIDDDKFNEGVEATILEIGKYLEENGIVIDDLID